MNLETTPNQTPAVATIVLLGDPGQPVDAADDGGSTSTSRSSPASNRERSSPPPTGGVPELTVPFSRTSEPSRRSGIYDMVTALGTEVELRTRIENTLTRPRNRTTT
ncbi:hypothetical protein [Polymorphospora sp. NPDC050346]|uniref:hypothetical protein n=1 Tax=Polymorphospora sp. NPDC050346 TaxID=3155780 RepID=UPI0033FDA135